MKNILVTFLFKEGAGPVFTLEMARGLMKNNCNVYAILSDAISNKIDWENEKDIKDICFISTGTRKDAIKSSVNFFLFGYKALKRRYKDVKFDCVISTFFHPWAVIVMKQLNSARTMTICHDPKHHSGVKKSEEVLTKYYIKSADEVIVLTEKFIPIVKDNFGFPENKIHYMPHGRMSEYKNKQKLKAKEFYNSENVNFVFFGRIEKYKGLTVLAEAYKRLKSEFTNITLTVAGSGDFEEYRAMFSILDGARIINKYIPDEEVGWYFDGPNVVTVLPYLDATQSGVIPIAMEYLTPIIASDTGGLRSQLDEGRIGIFFESGNVIDLYDKMKRCIEDPKILIDEGEKMDRYLKKLDWDIVTKKLLIDL